MGRVLKLRNVALVSLLAVAAMLLFAWSGARTAEAGHTFTPSYTTSLSPAGPGIPGDIRTINTITAPDANFETLSVNFLNKAWTILPIGSAPSLGGVAGQLTAVSTLGLLNGPCTTTTPVAFPLHASVTGGADDGSVRGPADTTWSGFLDVAPADGLSDGITTYPLFLDGNITRSTSGDPLVRLYGDAVVAGQPIAVNILQYAPNGLAAEFPVLPEMSAAFDLGYPSVVLLQNPVASDTPSSISDFCAPLVTDITTFGLVKDNPNTVATEGGFAQINPASGTFAMALFQISDRDEDGDGIEGDLDSCPGVVNLEDPRVPFPVGDPDLDAIDSACDNTSVTTDGNLRPWDAGSPCRQGTADDFLALDCDGDGFSNRQDNCPQVFSPGNADDSEILFNKGLASPPSVTGIIALDGGPADDGIGNACDADLTGSNGHFTAVLLPASVTVLDPDSDGDLFPDFVEVLLGSVFTTGAGELPGEAVVDAATFFFCSDGLDNDGDGNIDAADAGCSTPENLISIGAAGGIGTCIDGADNDKDGATDFADDSCGLPHDIEILSISGNSKVKEDQRRGYSVNVANNGSTFGPPDAPEVVPVAVAVLPLTGCAPPGIDVRDVLGTGPPDGKITAADGNLPVDVNGDTIVDTLAFTATGVILPFTTGAADFNVIYPDCPGVPPPGPKPQTLDTTIADFVVLADACHLGDNAVVAPLFGGAPCGGPGAPGDGGIDLNFGNDGPVTRIINVTDYLRVPCNPIICP